MCGGINTNIAKLTNACTVLDAEGVSLSMNKAESQLVLRGLREWILESHAVIWYSFADSEKETRLMCVGSKGINPMKRLQGDRLDGALTDYTKNKITFATVRLQSNTADDHAAA